MDFGKLTPDQERIRNLIVQHATEQGVDPDLAQAVGWTESQFKHNALGPQTKYGRAIGPMQVMGTNAHGLGMKSHELYIPEKNVQAGVRLLKENLERFGGHENAALAAYNASPHHAENYVKNNYDEKYLPAETRNYFQKVAAARGQNMTDKSKKDEISDDELAKFFPFLAGKKPEKKEEEKDIGPNPFGEHLYKPLTTQSAPAVESKQLLSSVPDYMRNEEGEISPLPAMGVGLGVGTVTPFMDKKAIADRETRQYNAKHALTQAEAEQTAYRKAAAQMAAQQGTTTASTEAEFLAKQAAAAKLQSQLEQAMEHHQSLLPEDLRGAAKYTAGVSGNMAPEIPYNQIKKAQDYSKYNQNSAWNIVQRNQDAMAKQAAMGEAGMKLTPAGESQLVLPENLASEKRQNVADAIKQAEERVAALREQSNAAKAEAAAAEALHKTQATNASRVQNSSITDLAKKAANVDTAQIVNKEVNRGNLGPFGKTITALGSSAVGKGLQMAGGLGIGYAATEAVNAYNAGEKGRAAKLAASAALQALSMMPAGTPLTAALKAIGIGGGLALEVIDALSDRTPAAPPKAQPQAKGALSSLYNPASKSNTTMLAQDAAGRYHI